MPGGRNFQAQNLPSHSEDQDTIWNVERDFFVLIKHLFVHSFWGRIFIDFHIFEENPDECYNKKNKLKLHLKIEYATNESILEMSQNIAFVYLIG